ncbi:hypothetical protein PENSPDRAFT_756965 [Peniophora sp. CONT]|nr:hypothetical protein PENSPDRAFT_756965 [Peniophora sp. CONT]
MESTPNSPSSDSGSPLRTQGQAASTDTSPNNSNSGPTPAAESTSGPSSSADDVVSPDGEETQRELTSVQRVKLKRNRLILSCQPCHKRKQQCDRGHPCFRCVKRGTIADCVYEQPPQLNKRKNNDDEGERDDHHDHSYPNHDSLNGPAHPGSSYGESSTPNYGQFATDTGPSDNGFHSGFDSLLDHHSTGSPVTPFDSTNTSNSVREAAVALGQLAQSAPPQITCKATSNVGLSTGIPRVSMQGSDFADMLRLPGIAAFRTVMAISEWAKDFPNPRLQQYLYSYYFDKSSLHWYWPIVHRPCFDALYQHNLQKNVPLDLDFLTLTAIVMALALQFLPESDDDAFIFADHPAGRHKLQERMHAFADMSLHGWTEYPDASFQRVQAHALYSMYEWHTGNAGIAYFDCGLAIRMAQTLSMNRDPIKHWGTAAYPAEVKRRLWWLLFVLDRWHCIHFNRPYMIMEQHMDVEYPCNLDQSEILDVPELVPKSIDVATEYLFHIVHAKYGRLVGRVYDGFFSLSLPTYRDVLDLEDQVRKFELEVPSSLRYQTTSDDRLRPYLAFQNKMLTLELGCMRTYMLAPFLFVHPVSPNDMAQQSPEERKLAEFHKHAKVVCIMFAKRMIALLNMFHAQAEPAYLIYPTISVMTYTAAIVLIIAIIIEPGNPENDELDEWITLAEDLLKLFQSRNVLAKRALPLLHVIRRRSLMTRCISGPQHFAMMDGSCECTMGRPEPTFTPSKRMERATRVLAHPSPSVTDLLGPTLSNDPIWAGLRPGVFASHMPGVESLSGSVDPQQLDDFFDSCTAMQSRSPPVLSA